MTSSVPPAVIEVTFVCHLSRDDGAPNVITQTWCSLCDDYLDVGGVWSHLLAHWVSVWGQPDEPPPEATATIHTLPNRPVTDDGTLT